MTLDQKALEAAENAYAAATMDLPHHDCEDCGGSGVVITGRGETAGGDTCATCEGGGVVVDFPEGWNPMASAIAAYLAALPSSPAAAPSPPTLDGAGRDGIAELLADANTKMAIRLADRLIAEGFQEPDEDTAVLSKATIQLSDVLRSLCPKETP